MRILAKEAGSGKGCITALRLRGGGGRKRATIGDTSSYFSGIRSGYIHSLLKRTSVTFEQRYIESKFSIGARSHTKNVNYRTKMRRIV